MTLPRYSSRSFPSYRFVPEKAPHPTRDPNGHSFNKLPDPLESFDREDWKSCEEYLYGIDLFNHGFWWEAHEALETVWVAAGRRTKTGLFIQGLIQIGVAHLKWFQGFHDTATHMAMEGLKKMQRVNGIYLGIELTSLRSTVESYFLGEDETPVRIELVGCPVI